MAEIQPNKLNDLLVQAADLFKKNAEKIKVKELKPEVPTTGAVANELENARLPEGSLARTPKGDIILHGEAGAGKTQLPSIAAEELRNITSKDFKTISQTTEKAIKEAAEEAKRKYNPKIITFIGDEPIKGVVAQDINTSILPKHNIVDRPDLRDK